MPSATLALALGAFFLTQDKPALRSVYGPDLDLEGHLAWVDVLKAGGDASALGGVMFAAVAIPAAAGAGLFALGRRLTAYPPWVLAAIGVSVGLLAVQVSSETWRKLRSGLSDTATAFVYVYARYAAAFESFRRKAPSLPGWEELAQTNDRRMVLARACLHALARSPVSDMSARELAGVLPSLGVGQGEQLVRQAMRAHSCFDQPYQGRWQVGRVARPLLTARDAAMIAAPDSARFLPVASS